MTVPYQGGLGGVRALALLFQASDELILGGDNGGEGSIFLLQLPVVTGHLQGLNTHALIKTLQYRQEM